MRHWLVSLMIVVAVLGMAAPALAHPAPFSFVDIRIGPDSIGITVVVHVFDAAHDLGIQPPERLLDPAILEPEAKRLWALLRERLHAAADRRPLALDAWPNVEPLPDRQAVRLRIERAISRTPGVLEVSANLFPYDPVHQTFLNIYEGDALTSQAILSQGRTEFEYFAGSRQGILAVARKFVTAGVHHILIGPDHLLFLVGLLLLGGSRRRLLVVVSAFTLAHSVTLSLAALNVFTPPPSLVEPAIALSIVYVGADNLMVRGGRDMRAWIALAFGLIHGFGFANVLGEMQLPNRALAWSLFSFNLGVEIGQLAVVMVVATALLALRSRSEAAGRHLAYAGSIAVMAAGVFWFVQRLLFPGGTA
jgi:hydrogenase/urease accessory protein HupE